MNNFPEIQNTSRPNHIELEYLPKYTTKIDR